MSIWNESDPKGSSSPGSTALIIVNQKTAIKDRMDRGHFWNSTSTVDGFHREGTFVAYYDENTPQFRPNAEDQLDSNDTGRLYVKKGTSNPAHLNLWNGTSFIAAMTGRRKSFAHYQFRSSGQEPAYVALSWTHCPLNIEVTDDIGITFAFSDPNYILYLPAGTYYVEWFWAIDISSIEVWFYTRLRDITAGVTIVDGNFNLPVTGVRESSGRGIFTVGVTTNIQLQYYLANNVGSPSWMDPGFDEDNITTDIVFWRIDQ